MERTVPSFLQLQRLWNEGLRDLGSAEAAVCTAVVYTVPHTDLQWTVRNPVIFSLLIWEFWEFTRWEAAWVPSTHSWGVLWAASALVRVDGTHLASVLSAHCRSRIQCTLLETEAHNSAAGHQTCWAHVTQSKPSQNTMECLQQGFLFAELDLTLLSKKIKLNYGACILSIFVHSTNTLSLDILINISKALWQPEVF